MLNTVPFEKTDVRSSQIFVIVRRRKLRAGSVHAVGFRATGERDWSKIATVVTYRRVITMKTLKLKTSLAGLGLGVAMVLGGCAVTGEVDATKSVEVEMQKVDMAANAAALAAVLAAQPDEVQARYDARNPAATGIRKS